VGVSKFRTLVGSIFMRKLAMRKDALQNFNGIEVLASKARLTSTMRWCLRSAETFC
jgi:hypothetical protein